MSYQLIQGDCLEVLRTMADASISAVVTDPPYGLSDHDSGDVAEALRCWLDGKPYTHGKGGFMSRAWDGFVPGPEVWREVYRVLKPGGHLLAFAGSRTHDLMGIAIRLAGFELRDTINELGPPHYLGWVQGQGFPKSHDVSKAIDKAAGVERGDAIKGGHIGVSKHGGDDYNGNGHAFDKSIPHVLGKGELTRGTPVTDAAKRFAGFGSALKPALEPILLFRKPLAEPTIAAQVLANGCGGLNIDGTRVGNDTSRGDRYNGKPPMGRGDAIAKAGVNDEVWEVKAGRWPPNLVLSHSPLCQRIGSKRVKGTTAKPAEKNNKTARAHFEERPWMRERIENGQPLKEDWAGYADAEGMETIDAWECADGCPVKLLDEQAGERPSSARPNSAGKFYATKRHIFSDGEGYNHNSLHADSGNVSRYFPVFEPDPDALFLYASKASRSDRSSNGAVNNTHPTCKPTALGRWLSRLICPPGGTILDPFAGSGSLGVAAILEGFNWIGIDAEADYVSIARARCEWALTQRPAAVQTRLAV